jgi:hypothetical protein
MRIATVAGVLLLGGPALAQPMAKQSRAFFEKLIDFKIEKDLLVVKSTATGDLGTLLRNGRSRFTNVSRFSIRWNGGSSSSYGGSGGGNVNISFQQNGVLTFQLNAPNGRDSMTLKQSSPGTLTLVYKSGKKSISYSQSKGKCTLRIKAGRDSVSVSKRSFNAVVQAHPEQVRKHLVAVLESWFDDVPVLRYAAAPPGKVAFHLRDGTYLVGELKIDEAELETDYGTLILPRAEMRQILFPGALAYADAGGPPPAKQGPDSDGETVVVMRRFTPRGTLHLDTFQVKTQYGTLEILVDDVLHVAFGPPLEEEGDGGGESSEAAG